MGSEVAGSKKKLLRIPESVFKTKLVQEVNRKLLNASQDSSAPRGELLRQIFTDVALNVDKRAQELLLVTPHEVTGPGQGQGLRRETEESLCFYEVLAEHYASVPEDTAAVLPSFLSLWSQSFTCEIFALLLYQWLFDATGENQEEILRYSSAFVDGASRVFWIDLSSNVRRFVSLFRYLTDEVVLNVSRMGKVPPQARTQLVNVVSRFFFFYAPAEKLGLLLTQLPDETTHPFQQKPADVFVSELTNQLQKIKVEPVLVHYLTCMKVLKGMELRLTTSIRMQSALYSLTSPGGPLYPTRVVRHEAWRAIDTLYPVGRSFRHLISLGFRLLHPWYWPDSFWNFIAMKVGRIWQWLFPPDPYVNNYNYARAQFGT